MKYVVLGAHLRREDIEPIADVLPVDDLFLSAIPIADVQPLGDRDLVVRAAAVRARLVANATFIAIRYGFTAKDAAEAAAKCAGRSRVWRRLLEAHADEVEMTLKVAAVSKTSRPRRRDFTDGAAYLRALHASTRAVAIDDDFRAAADSAIGRLATAVRWIHRDDASMEMVALVRRSRLAEVEREGESLKQRFAAVPFLLSGPWPLEVFADADLE